MGVDGVCMGVGCGAWGDSQHPDQNLSCFSHFPQPRESAVFPPRLRREPVKTPGPGLAVQQFQFQFQFLWLQILMRGLWICGSSC